jgi:hypothetical protein
MRAEMARGGRHGSSQRISDLAAPSDKTAHDAHPTKERQPFKSGGGSAALRRNARAWLAPTHEDLTMAVDWIDPITQPPTTVQVPNATNISAAYPTFIDWTLLYDKMPGDYEARRARFLAMKGEHEKFVFEQVRLVTKKSVGRAVVVEIMLAPLCEVRILPFEFQPKKDQTGAAATTGARDYVDAGLKNAPVAGANSDGKRYFLEKKSGSPVIGTGVGSSADIFFSPNRTKTPDETMLHEMVHASRMVRGVAYDMPVNEGYGNLEEFLAVVVTNMYRAQLQRPIKNYQHRVISEKDFWSSNLMPTASLLLAYMRNKQRSLFERLADLDDAPFNPMKQVRDTEKALIRKIESTPV